MRSIVVGCCTAAVIVTLGSPCAHGQMMPGQGGMGGRPSSMNQPGGEISNTPAPEKPDAAARKAYTAGMKTLAKAKEQQSNAASALNEDKKNAALEKMNDAYGRALDQFTEALRNQGDLYDAWNQVGYIHLRLGAFGESVDDYNHALALKADLPEAVEHRAEAYLALDRLEEAKSAYMDLFNHAPPLAETLLGSMQRWLTDHRSNANGMRPATVEAFAAWLQERDGIAKQAVALPR